MSCPFVHLSICPFVRPPLAFSAYLLILFLFFFFTLLHIKLDIDIFHLHFFVIKPVSFSTSPEPYNYPSTGRVN